MPDISSEKSVWDTPFHYCAFAKAEERLARLQELGVGIEIMLDDSRFLWPDILWEEVLGLADRLAQTGIPALLHGPFNNLNLGARDEHIRQYSRDLILRGFRVARTLASPHMVIHLGFLPQFSPEAAEAWWRCFTESLPVILTEARLSGVTLLVENTYEDEPAIFEKIFEQFDSPALGLCLDIGHAHCYSSVPVEEWVRRFRYQIRHLHLSDNDGQSDRHWTLGTGTLNPLPVLELLARRGEQPSITLEVPFDTLEESLNSYRQTCQSAFQGYATP
ncbi:MAG: sugar phosphate isomerase/epimerase family protein [bacterium]